MDAGNNERPARSTGRRQKFGNRLLQKLRAPEIDKVYADMAEAKIISPRTQHHVHTVFGALLATAKRKALISVNPMERIEQIPAPENFDPDEDEIDEIGEGLTESELKTLVAGFTTSSIYPVVVLAAATGARRNELLALRWSDLDIDKKTLRIERALEQTKKFGIRIKPPKTKRGFRTIDLDDGTIAVLLKVKEQHQRLKAGIPDDAEIDLSLIRLPNDALMFPAVSVSFTTPATRATSQGILPTGPTHSASAGFGFMICAAFIRPGCSTLASPCTPLPSGSVTTPPCS